ncbi:toll/interleukin-1 receptor domain-containing protein [Pyxidicoccus caerfyrddinensis]|uniref:toll/interleukin-1 receptor domain-containing protein n=1 Tax=Pyxidicoccus caerfyrddinensis TaxID=2709663 RepID=UPI0013D9D0E9|nr:toll/interleukin-1 receptor domain-containing protein [Pyxidicoccus caerfyrddinensis]
MTKVFLSYARRDGSTAAARLRMELERAGVVVWRDIEGMRGGADWKAQLRAQLRETDAVLVLLTPGAVESKMVTWEWENALTLEKQVIPLLVQPCEVPADLGRLHHHPLHKPEEYALSLMALIRDLTELVRSPTSNEPAPSRGDGSTFYVHGATHSAIGPSATVINNAVQPQATSQNLAASDATAKKPS